MQNERQTKQSSESLLIENLRAWASLYGRALNDSAVAIWLKIFRNNPAGLLAIALESLTKKSDRMPTPGHLTKELELVREQKPWLNPNASQTPKPTEGKDASGVPCIYWSNEPSTPTYRAVDCKEGRGFLAAFAGVAGKTPDQCAKLMEKWSSGGGRVATAYGRHQLRRADEANGAVALGA